ncbi:MAG TPA: YbaY family lipoprotein [Spongiibacteraceae bacterium]|nr:YbaY family lipoprotein [Spongiibacteraceae bacterium]
MRQNFRSRLRLAGAVLCLMALGACDTASGLRDVTLEGELYYRERIALPPDAVAAVVLADVSRADMPAQTVASDVIPTAGRQVPIPFTLRYPSTATEAQNRYVLRASIRDARGQLLWTTDTVYPLADAMTTPPRLLLVQARPDEAAVATPTEAGTVPERSLRAGETFVYDCQDPRGGDFQITLRNGPGEAALWLPQRFEPVYRVLGQVVSASGAKYQEGDVVVWTKGDTALLEIDGETYRDCVHNPHKSVWEGARLSGIDFRAVGNEPGWLLEIRDRRKLRFVYNYGEQEVSLAASAPVEEHATAQTLYNARDAKHELRVILQALPCQDDMSGEQFSTTVTVDLDGQRYRGCGRSLH